MQAIAGFATKIDSDDARHLAGKIAVVLMQEANKTAHDQTVTEILITIQDKDSNNCLMTAIKNEDAELTIFQ